MNKLLPIGAIAAALITATPPIPPHTGEPDVRIMGMKAVLYFEGDASLSSFDVMQDGPEAPSLWNTSAGEGAAAGKASNATLVLVLVSGPRGSLWKATLHLTASDGTRRVADRLIPLQPFSFGTPSVWIPIILYGTGCAKLGVTAAIREAPSQLAVTKTVPFRCGE